jgi:hypothetical protein
MILEFFGDLLELIGSVMIAYTILGVHYRFRKEKKMDIYVIRAMNREHFIGMLGISLIISGFIVKSWSHFL